ncbi:hypothetical protein [Halobacteriovorax sp. HLS]|uniref:hypothetical protein n=1 Tax=Halobacteriovorax sp. HLS TaxID=2234000 RepID=UPI000FD6C743|nr:hypothetical protein [Halobacteriovorax sp. HLS]
MIKNERGSSQLIMCLLLLVLSGIMVIVIGHSLNTYKQASTKLNTLICMRKSQFYLSEFVSSIAQANKIIRVNFPLKHSKIPYVSQTASVLIKGLILKQNYELYKYYRNTNAIKECAKSCKMHLLQAHPYKVKLGFIRNLDETTSFKTRTFSAFYYSTNFLSSLKSKVTVKSTLSTKVYIETRKTLHPLNDFLNF